ARLLLERVCLLVRQACSEAVVRVVEVVQLVAAAASDLLDGLVVLAVQIADVLLHARVVRVDLLSLRLLLRRATSASTAVPASRRGEQLDDGDGLARFGSCGAGRNEQENGRQHGKRSQRRSASPHRFLPFRWCPV